MNRIILIGNGFDLAHGMATSYKDFLNDYWSRINIELCKPELIGHLYDNDDIRIDVVPQCRSKDYTFEGLNQRLIDRKQKLNFKNKFLEIITTHKSLKNWVDIETEYYRLLKLSITNPNRGYNINALNLDFERVKRLFEEYLVRIDTDFRSGFKNVELVNKIASKIYSHVSLKEYTGDYFNKISNIEYKKIEPLLNRKIFNASDVKKKNLINSLQTNPSCFNDLLLSDNSNNFFDLGLNQVLFLNFNYTYTHLNYYNFNDVDNGIANSKIDKNIIQIHGSIDENSHNPIIFGFGDELDEDYKLIENRNDNEYLENIKSIKYLNTMHYKRLLEFINSSEYQICIFGHSCGISDRTLLNTLFEHHNCVSIKPYYHQKSENEDNYSDIVRNISRNFNNKAVMREKVVNKQYCEPLC